MTTQLTGQLVQSIVDNRNGLYDVVYLYGKEESVSLLLDVVVLTASAQLDKKVTRIKAGFLADEWCRDILQGRKLAMPEGDILIMENIHEVAGREHMEQLLYGLFDRFLESHRRLIITGNVPTAQILLLAERIRAQIDGGVAFCLE